MKNAIKKIMNEKTVIHISTVEQLKEINKVICELGIKPFSCNYDVAISKGNFCVNIEPIEAWWCERKYYLDKGYKVVEFKDLCKNETIVIYRKGNETIALDKRTGKKAVAKCCPDDTYNFDTGAELAFKRLKEQPPLNTKICVTSIDRDCPMTVGKIYEICGGKFTDDGGSKFPLYRRLYSIDELIDYLRADNNDEGIKYSSAHIHFVEVVE